MIGHLGSKVTALLDGRLPAAEEERAWEHVHTCHPCRDAVEREGWVKTQLAQLGHCSAAAPSSSLRDSLLSVDLAAPPAYPDALPTAPHLGHQGLRPRHLAVLGSSAVGMAVLGVVALGVAPANAPQVDRRGPVTSVVPPRPAPATTPVVTTSVRQYVVRETITP